MIPLTFDPNRVFGKVRAAVKVTVGGYLLGGMAMYSGEISSSGRIGSVTIKGGIPRPGCFLNLYLVGERARPWLIGVHSKDNVGARLVERDGDAATEAPAGSRYQGDSTFQMLHLPPPL